MKTIRPLTATLSAVAMLAMSTATWAGQFLIDLSDLSGSAAGWDVFSADVTDAAVTDQNAVDNDVTLSITGILGNNNPSPAGATTVDGVTVPLEANNDYVWGDNQGNGGSILFEFKNLDAGSYNLSVFAGRTSDANQEGTIWVGAVGDEPAKNTDDFANSSATLLVSVGAGDSLFYRHSPGTDWVGGTSGLIIKRPIGGGGGNDFSDWIAGYSVGGQTGIDDDPDGDGVDSGVENFFGTAPDAFSQGLVSGTVSGGTFTFTHPQTGTIADDLTAGYRWSKDLQTFNADGATDGAGTKVDFTVDLDTPDPGTTTVTATVTAGPIPDKMFVDVEVTQP